jgi:hypothetical protein
MYRASLALVIPFICAATASAVTPLFQHAGNANPTSEGWSTDFSGTAITTGATSVGGAGEFNDTENAWRINDNSTTGRGIYFRDVAGLEYLDARSGGWQLDGRMKSTDTTTNASLVSKQFRYLDEGIPSGGEMQYRVSLTTNASGQSIVNLTGTATTVNVGTGYHDYSLRFNPVTQVASLHIDGAVGPALTSSGALINPSAFATSQVNFGSPSTAETGAANYALVRFSTQGVNTILAGYGFDGGSAASLDINAQSVASSMTAGAGLPTAGFSSATTTAFVPASGTPGSAATALSSNAYFSFTVTPNTQQMLNLNSLFAELGVNTSAGFSQSYTGDWFVRSSIDGFSANLATATASVTGFTDVDGDAVGDMNLIPVLIDLSAAQFQGLLNPVEFRFYISDNSAVTGAFVRMDNVVLRGTALTIPEPNTLTIWGLVAGFSTAWIVWRRRASNR